MSRFSTASRETAGQVLVLTRQGISLGSYSKQIPALSGLHALCRAFPACRHAVGTIS